MSLSSINRLGAGVVFGAALTASRVYVPSVIVSQMKLRDFHMMATFLTASASSAILIALFDHLSIAKRQPRLNSSINWFSAYDANIIGGLLIGTGMAVTGACPGTTLVQVATGIESGYYVTLGGLLGGIAYAKFGHLFKRQSQSSTASLARQHTIDAKFQWDLNSVLLTYELLCLAIIAGSIAFGGINSESPYLHPVLGGSLIGLAQAASLILTGGPVGVSAAYAEAGNYFWRIFPSNSVAHQPLKYSATTFAAGMVMGSFGTMKYLPMEVKASDISRTNAILGGFVMIVGARLAGGCTSGHGISGMSSFSVSSVISVISMFAGGIAVATLLG